SSKNVYIFATNSSGVSPRTTSPSTKANKLVAHKSQ
ncbi:hypothetical protein NT04LS_2753a, partial [Listeria seeligeri FSL S4-171]